MSTKNLRQSGKHILNLPRRAVKTAANSRSGRTMRTAVWHLRHGGPMGVARWVGRKLGPAMNDRAFDPMKMPELTPTMRAKAFGHVRAAVILDEFSAQAWGYEFSTIPVTPQGWLTEISEGIDLLLVESAWNGNSGAWQYQLTGSQAPSAALRDLVAHCKENGIPTVFWNKEDPPHYEDFLDTARLFDAVFTSDSNLIPQYRRDLGHNRIEAMSFAAQPAVHNPIRDPKIPYQQGDVAFAGMYFAHKYPERREQMKLLLDAAVAASRRMRNGLTIYSRFVGQDAKYQFPEPYADHVVGSLPYRKMLSAYKAFKVFLNVNSVVDSPSMCARRIFEISAAGTPVVTTPSRAIGEFFDSSEITVVDSPDEAEWALRALVNSPELRDRMVHRAQRKIWSHHTYTHRAQSVLHAAGLGDEKAKGSSLKKISVIVSTNRPEQLDHVLTQVGRQTGVDLELLYLTHGFELDAAEFRRKVDSNDIAEATLLAGNQEWTLGRCLNELVHRAQGDYIAKFDDDDYYAQHYLQDQFNAITYSGADVVGKQASYLYLESRDLMILRNPGHEHRWTDFVAGPTLFAPAAIFREIPFDDVSRGEDTAFLREASLLGKRIYSSDRFNFMQSRAATGHTWEVEDLEFLANGRVESVGLTLNHVEC